MSRRTLTAEEIANYVVCPEAWRLKYVAAEFKRPENTESEGVVLKKEWTKRQDLSRQLSSYAKIAYLLLVALAIIAFLLDQRRMKFDSGSAPQKQIIAQDEPESLDTGREPKSIPPQIFQLLLVLGLLIFMWDFFERRSKKLKKDSGLSEQSRLVAARGSSSVPAQQLHSSVLGLTSNPDAVVEDADQLIPVDVYPVANKVQDRHVMRLLVHLRLLEEQTGKAPPYGILVMGKKKRQVQIKNVEDKQRWLESIVDEMRSILDGVPAVPAPHVQKCKFCDVRARCAFSAYTPGRS